jgi:hypothetical protein
MKIIRPWHLWVIAIVSVLFLSIGAYDFIGVASHNMAYLTKQYSAAGVEYFTNYPVMLLILFGINVFGTIAAMIIAFWRKKWATIITLIAAVSDLILILMTVFGRGRIEAIGLGLTIQDMAVDLAIFALAYYFWWLSKKESDTP